MTDEQLLADARDAFALCEEAESENRLAALDDLRFAKLGEQWPESVRQQRIKDGRPCLTINRQPAFSSRNNSLKTMFDRRPRTSRPALPAHGGQGLCHSRLRSQDILNPNSVRAAPAPSWLWRDIAPGLIRESGSPGLYFFLTIIQWRIAMAQSNLELPRWPDDASDKPVDVNPDGILGGISWPAIAPDSLGLTDSAVAYPITATETVPFALDPANIDARLPDLGTAADQNRQFYSAAGGTVMDAGWENPRNHNQGYGYRIRVRGNDGLLFTYGHTDPDSAQVYVGDQVSSGQYLGRYGDPTNGRSTGPHTHFEVRDPSHPLQREYDAYIKNSRGMGALVNPAPYVGTVLPNGVISGYFGPRTMRGKREFHPGVDIKQPLF